MANSATYRHVRGIGDLTAALRALSEEMRTHILAEGVKGAIAPILKAAKANAGASKDTGALQASLTTKVVNYPRNGKCVGLVGPDRAYYVAGSKTTKLGQLHANARKPANYAHLVEYGHRIAVGGTLKRLNGKGRAATGKVGGFVPAKPFLRPAVESTTAEQAEGFYQGIAKGYEKALGKHAGKAA